MTDGCGFMNGAALTKLAQVLYGVRHTGIQARIYGSKGLWILHSDDHDPEADPKIWIRFDSQKKVNLPPADHVGREHRILNVVAPSRVSSSRLNPLLMMNLSYNGVPDDIFVTLLKEGLEQEIKPLMDWDSAYSNVVLAYLIERLGGIVHTRIMRDAEGFSRALGLTGRDHREENCTDDKPMDLLEDDVAEIVNGKASVVPEPARNRYEGLLELLMAGFTPLQSRLVNDKLKEVIKLCVEKYVKDGHIPIPSVEAFLAPGDLPYVSRRIFLLKAISDPLNILPPGKIFFLSSKPLKDPRTLETFYQLKGQFPVSRYLNSTLYRNMVYAYSMLGVPEPCSSKI
jgi:RNA-dependent RNA polymerase